MLMLFWQWARDQFEGFFTQQVQVANDYLSDPQKCLEHVRNLCGYEKVRTIISVAQKSIRQLHYSSAGSTAINAFSLLA